VRASWLSAWIVSSEGGVDDLIGWLVEVMVFVVALTFVFAGRCFIVVCVFNASCL